MSISVTAKKTLAALILAAPLTLAACGSEAEDTAAGTTTPAAEETTEATAAEESTETAAEEAPEGEQETEGEDTAPADGGNGGATVSPDTNPAAALEEAFANDELTYAQLPPVESGAPADEADAAAIQGLVNGMYETTTIHGFLRYLPDNTCSAVIEAQGGEGVYNLTGPDVPLNQIPQWVDAQPHIESVTDIQVDGDVASASVTAVSAGQSETATQRFLREDGTWKFCN